MFYTLRSPPKSEVEKPILSRKRKSDEIDNWHMKNLSSMFTSFDDDNDSDFEMDVGTGKLTLYAQMGSSFWFDTINLGWSIV